jgi:hypothetical protein
MKSASITVTKENAKNNINFYRFWSLVFFALILISAFFKGPVFIYHTAGLFLSLVYWYFNYKSLGVKGNIVMKETVDRDSLKSIVMLSKATFSGWVVLSVIIFGIMITMMPGILIDAFFFFIFVLTVLYKRMRMLSKALK